MSAEKPGFESDKKRKTVIEDSIIDNSEISGDIVIKGKVIIDGKEVNENFPEAENAREIMDLWKKTKGDIKEGKFDNQPETSQREVKIPIVTVKELMDKGIDENTAQRMVTEAEEDAQDFRDAMSGIELMKQMKKSKAERESREQRICSSCKSPMESSAKFCTRCGTKAESEQSKKCPKCAGESPARAIFCGRCGTKI